MSGINVDLRGEKALVIGGSSGIGKAVTFALAESGAAVAVVGRNFDSLEAVCAEINHNGTALPIKCDISNTAEITAMIEKAYLWRNEGLDIMVNCAGLNNPVAALEATEEQWNTMIDTNLRGAFFCSQAAAKKMIPTGGGRIIHITSQLAHVALKDRVIYCASKSGLNHLCRVLALEWAPYSIRVNCVAPTFTRTPMTEPVFEDPQKYTSVLKKIPLGRTGVPEDYTGAVLFLVSESASLITGSTIIVDGGWTIE